MRMGAGSARHVFSAPSSRSSNDGAESLRPGEHRSRVIDGEAGARPEAAAAETIGTPSILGVQLQSRTT